MQTLQVSDSAPRTESRLKSLFWPSIESSSDVDYLGAQGYWVCVAVATLSLAVISFRGNWILGVFVFIIYFLGGVGVRERSRYAAASVFVTYLLDILASGRPSIVSTILAGLLFSNLRATWIAAKWSPGSQEAEPAPRFDESLSDKFADKLPAWLWPKIRYVYYVLSVCYLALAAIGMTVLIRRFLASDDF
jgi:hypothetical protein